MLIGGESYHFEDVMPMATDRWGLSVLDVSGPLFENKYDKIIEILSW